MNEGVSKYEKLPYFANYDPDENECRNIVLGTLLEEFKGVFRGGKSIHHPPPHLPIFICRTFVILEDRHTERLTDRVSYRGAPLLKIKPTPGRTVFSGRKY